MGNWTFYLRKDEEEKIRKLIAEGKYSSVYSFVRKAVQNLIISKFVEEAEKKDYWWRRTMKKNEGP